MQDDKQSKQSEQPMNAPLVVFAWYSMLRQVLRAAGDMSLLKTPHRDTLGLFEVAISTEHHAYIDHSSTRR